MKKIISVSFFVVSVTLSIQAQQINPVLSNTSIPSFRGAATDHIFIFGTTSTDALKLEDFTTTGGISIGFRPSDRMFGLLTFNYGGKLTTKENVDSAKLSSLFFPDIASSAFALSLERRIYAFADNQTSLWFCTDGSLQNRHFNKLVNDSTLINYQLGIANFNTGFKLRWDYGNGAHSSSLNFGAFLNTVWLNRDSNSDTFSSLFNDYQSPDNGDFQPRIIGLSFLASLQVDNIIFYTRTYTSLNVKNDLAFTVGFKIPIRAFSF